MEKDKDKIEEEIKETNEPKIIDDINEIESNIFSKLNEETFNFTNSLKLLLGKKIRIKAN